MLQGARRLKDEGVDVVIGLVETHGRAETSALLEGLEVLPRRMVEYRGRTIEEFDIDAALARKPELIVVDELAHTNAPESRHPKRWQDVQELLAAGIDVWTALNIQHLESLADVVSRITGVVVRETVPDRVLQEATDVVLVDITPDELIQRLNEGKVYVPETARRATQNFFTLGNLTALRELALRRTADRVDDQMVDYLRREGDRGPVGRLRASARLRRRGRCLGAGRAAHRAARDCAQRRLDRGHCRAAAAATTPTRRPGSPRRSASSSGSAATRCGSRAPTSPTRSCASRGVRTSPRSCSASRAPGSGAASSAARCRTRSCAAPGRSRSMSFLARRRLRADSGLCAKLRPEGARRRDRGGARLGRRAVLVGEALSALLRCPICR